MPKSKRAKKVSLTRTIGKGRARKESILDEVRECADRYSYCYAFAADNMRNTGLQGVRSRLRGSRIFFGRTKLLSAALGRTPAEEHRDELSQVAGNLSGGEAGLLFTDMAEDEVRRVLEESQVREYARAGSLATEDVELPEGPLHKFPHNMEPYLRKLGLPTRLDNGVVTLLAPHTVCEEGATLDGEQAKLLQLLDIKMALFKLSLKCRWEAPGTFTQYELDDAE